MIEDYAVEAHAPAPPTLGAPYAEAITRALASRGDILQAALSQLAREQVGRLGEVAALLVATLRTGHKVLVAGNGGSAAEAQHLAAELVGRFKRERAPYAVIALTTDSAILTALGNDYGYAEVFARQVGALGQPGDLFIAYSTSGESENLLRAAAVARRGSLATIAVTGCRPNRLARAADLALLMPCPDTATVQEMHMTITHLLCEIVENELVARPEGMH